jgi:prophage antirepressor-like protein
MARKDHKDASVETRIALFRGREVRKTIHGDEWWFSVADVVEVLTDTADVRQYVKKMRQRDSELNANWGTICTPLEILAPDGKMRETNCANTEGIFRGFLVSNPDFREKAHLAIVERVGLRKTA